MRALVTGASGFIGAALMRRLLDGGWDVRGIDLRPPDPALLLDDHVIRADVTNGDVARHLAGVDIAFHLAGQTGVRPSWQHLAGYLRHNVQSTQQVLAAAVDAGVRRVVLASSSSVYGDQSEQPLHEEMSPRPHSPYGATKLAAEQLCRMYSDNFGIETVALRYFTVYGPGQREDMAIRRLIHAAITGGRFELFGTGTQMRDFTYIDDVVGATVAAADAAVAPGTVVNVGGGRPVTMGSLVEAVERAVGGLIDVVRTDEQPGDVARTHADISRAHLLLGWEPDIRLPTGLARQVAWQRGSVASAAAAPVGST